MVNLKKLEKQTKSLSITIFLMKIIGMWPVSGKKQRILANLMTDIMGVFMIFSVIVQTQSIFYSTVDFKLITYAAPCAVVVVSEFSKLTVFIVNRKKVMDLNKSVEDGFWKINYSEEETKIFNDCDRLCFKAITIYAVLLQGIGWHYVLAPAIESIGKRPEERKFPFPMYFEFFPVSETPFYEVVYSFQIFGTMAVSLCTITFASYFFAMNMFIATQFKILNLNLRKVCDFPDDKNQLESYNELKNCIKKHQQIICYVDQFENLFCFVMLGQIFGSVTQICFSGFQLILANLTTLQRTILSAEYLFASFLQLYFYCYSSHEIYTESEKVAESIYSSQWFRITNPEILKDFSLMVQIIVYRSRRPCILTVGKFCPLTLDTFSSVLSTSLSYFTVLRQTIE